MVYFITRDVAVVTDLWCLAQVLGSVAPRMGVAEPLRRPTASRGRKRPRAAARLVGTSRAACCRPRLRVNPFLVWFVFLWLLFSGVWETLIFGTGDWFAFGEPFFCGLFTPTYPLPGHRLVPESHLLMIKGGTTFSNQSSPTLSADGVLGQDIVLVPHAIHLQPQKLRLEPPKP